MGRESSDGHESLSELIDLLKGIPMDSPLATAANVAMHRLADSAAEAVIDTGGEPQSSRQISDLYAFRADSGYYREKKIVGLREMIDHMSSEDIPVRLSYAKAQNFLISIWRGEDNVVQGILVFQ